MREANVNLLDLSMMLLSLAKQIPISYCRTHIKFIKAPYYNDHSYRRDPGAEQKEKLMQISPYTS
jgi:hypothetical protein